MSLVRLEQLESVKEWYNINPFVTGGYRLPRSPLNALFSAFEWHNETLTIYSHLLPGIVWLYMFFNCVKEDYYILSEPFTQNVIRYSYLSASLLGLASGTAHTFHIVNRAWSIVSWKLDFIGIIAINLCHQILDTYTVFHNNPKYIKLSVAIESIFALYCCIDIIVNLTNIHWGITYSSISSIILTLPATYISYHNDSLLLKRFSSYSRSCSYMVFIAGTIFFLGKIPERLWNPNGIFDNFNSHTWHHIFIVASIIYAFKAIPFLYLLEV